MTTQTLNSHSDNFTQELRAYQAETARLIRESRERQEKDAREFRERQEKTDWQIQETARQLQELGKKVQATTENVNGIAKSNGMFAEEYFFNAIAAKQTFGGIHFDSVQRNRERIRRLPDGQRLQSEFDVQLT
ncbi:MAG: hypothetical protein LBP75_04800, partial [Planctomycetota bacterium]|nr:hypothetical protein [Planctomycetota bacterium]